ncbi:hypothetical protein Clocel_0986 [Clostridium cellulovorans 743B]|uniref:Uncharacterized protein n=1 Tax=Clostridium cellulovorans (strain ATCC 35296 / DSM 3052 / OCM 3 / 743B) TaxID=573061 RepID=D9STD5_CLOC7|nr:hypothetical protein Clocel_0986 [Clostridium cellulovorans 743B]
MGFLGYKWETRVTIHLNVPVSIDYLMLYIENLMFIVKMLL